MPPLACAHCDKPLNEAAVYLATWKGDAGVTETAIACSHECADAVVDWGGHGAAAKALPEGNPRERAAHAQQVHDAREATVGRMSLALALEQQAALAGGAAASGLDAEPMGS